MEDQEKSPELPSRQLRRPIMFLEEALNDFKLLMKSTLRKLQGSLEKVIVQSDDSSNHIDSMKKEMHSLYYKQKQLMDVLDVKVDKAWVEQLVDAKFDKFNLVLKSMVLDIKELDGVSHLNMAAVSKNQVEVERLKSLVNDLIDESKQSDAHLRDAVLSGRRLEKESKQYQEAMKARVEGFLQGAKDAMDKQALEGARVESLVAKSDKRIKMDTNRLHTEISDSLKMHYEGMLHHMDKAYDRHKLLAAKIEELNEEMGKAMHAGKMGKEFEDFMKQVGYNAKQIAKLQQMMESK